ncbi:MAG: hypothetical protein LZT29_00099 [Pantoea stewartii]|nr:MAG: hypothetical protein LZT29_00099 [Pantoea stewartii]
MAFVMSLNQPESGPKVCQTVIIILRMIVKARFAKENERFPKYTCTADHQVYNFTHK